MKPLNIARSGTLSRLLQKDIASLKTIAKNIDDYYSEDQREKKSGKPRILKKPRYRLKIIQRNIKNLLAQIPLSERVHGWVKGRSVKSAVLPHKGMKYFYCFDIHSYFDSVHSTRVLKLFSQKLHCASEIAGLLTRLATYKACLPQGSPCSPVIANLILYDFDMSMSGYARGRSAKYTRLGDDILLSSNRRLFDATSVVIEGLWLCGLKINKDKTSVGIPSKSGIKVLGVVVGSGIALARKYRREVEAILYNAQNTGLSGQNREGRFDRYPV